MNKSARYFKCRCANGKFGFSSIVFRSSKDKTFSECKFCGKICSEIPRKKFLKINKEKFKTSERGKIK